MKPISAKPANKMIFWDVYLNGRLIDSAPYVESCDAEYVRDSLINHDGYDSRIVVRRSN